MLGQQRQAQLQGGPKTPCDEMPPEDLGQGALLV